MRVDIPVGLRNMQTDKHTDAQIFRQVSIYDTLYPISPDRGAAFRKLVYLFLNISRLDATFVVTAIYGMISTVSYRLNLISRLNMVVLLLWDAYVFCAATLLTD